MINLRPLFKADYDFLRRCLEQRFQTARNPLKKAAVALRSALKFPERGRFWLIERDSEPVGYAWVRHSWRGTETAQLTDLYGIRDLTDRRIVTAELVSYYRSLGNAIWVDGRQQPQLLNAQSSSKLSPGNPDLHRTEP